jgi:hypothetical protein
MALSKAALAYFREQGRKGGLIGGKISSENLTKKQRKARAKKAAAARWGKNSVA